MAREWREQGYSPAQIEEALGAQKPKSDAPHVFEVEPENRNAVRLYNRMQTQWHVETVVAGRVFFTRHHGLKYEVLPSMAGGLGIAVDEPLLDAIGIMEAEALRIYNNRVTASLQRA